MPSASKRTGNAFHRKRIVIRIDITNEQARVPVDEDRLRLAIAAVLQSAGKRRATISVAVVDDPTMHELNRRFLDHDYPTDVLSFVFEEDREALDGEIILSADTAEASAGGYGWQTGDELLLYAIHGALHLVGCDDKSPADAARMREQEALHLARFGLSPHAVEDVVPVARSGPAARQFSVEGTGP